MWGDSKRVKTTRARRRQRGESSSAGRLLVTVNDTRVYQMETSELDYSLTIISGPKVDHKGVIV